MHRAIYIDWQFQQIFNSEKLLLESFTLKVNICSLCVPYVTNLVTSLDFQLVRCATMLFHFGRTRNGYVATRFILFSSTADSSATSGNVVAPERSGQSEAWVGRNVERARKKPSFVSNCGFNRCSISSHVNMNYFSIYINFSVCN